jgi:integrase
MTAAEPDVVPLEQTRSRKRRKRAPGEGSVYKVKGRDLWCGEWRGTKLYGKTAREARQKLNQWIHVHGKDLRPEAHTATVADALKRWLTQHKANVRTSTFRRSDESKVRLHLIPLLGHEKLRTLTPGLVNTALSNARLFRGSGRVGDVAKTAKPLSDRSRQMLWGLLSQALDYAVGERWLTSNPLKAIGANRPKVKRSRSVIRAWDEDQRRRFLAVNRHMPYYPLWVILLHAGLRIGEAGGLQVEDVDLVTGSLSVSKQLLRDDRTLGPCKTDNSVRIVPLPKAVVEVLRKHIGDRRTGFLFVSDDDTPIHQRNINRSFMAAQSKAQGLPRLKLHGARHTTATLWLERGIPVHRAARWLGDTVATMMATYVHALQKGEARASQLLEEPEL